jgi:hypothetical protein
MQMSKRLTRVLVVLSMGGMTFGFGFLQPSGCQQPFYGNQPGVTFATALGNAQITTIVNQSLDDIKNFTITDADAARARNTVVEWLRAPLTNLYTNIWGGYVGKTIAQDPTYNSLLVQ